MYEHSPHLPYAAAGFSDTPAPAEPPSDSFHSFGDHRYGDIARRVTLLERDNRTLLNTLHGLQQRLRDLEEDLHAQEISRRQTAPPPSAANDHLAIAREYLTCVEQHVHPFAREATIKLGGQLRPEPLHRTIAALTATLFGTPTPTPRTVLDAAGLPPHDTLTTTAAQLCERANGLRRRAKDTGMPFAFDFEYVHSAPLDETWQKPWASCEPDLPIQFVVAPAYLVAERVYAQQLVHTGMPCPA
ncbi:hypothetical protein OHU17_00145 [Streptomyces goshikiensis]|uniref:Uncharacterized protein n=1 Tax=Streptomyces goshikiensis TaxID=1942 RepID=A0ABZ1RCY2_9ACTN|nr:hypothetical protein [Streptomyces goshikiensis]